ncbi:hypothetical protein FNV43_RR25735 [Rhamnella rubrinervis]|uniref:Receptor-like serine/threonine-protein kinase n=1 Tax=Rhamnella rubrinervis TaxID=2594499 RepID=A0A8K0GQT7_9ROSA|nr:hypothetical protein FNV43_RR25735 [Rhamnella rubrinervis]
MAVTMLHHVCIFLLLLQSLLQYAQTIRIELSSSLATDSSPWRSSNGDFAFGFHRLEDQSQLFLLAIWYDRIPEKTVVWYANGDNLAAKGSKVELTSGGSLRLIDQKGNVIWRAENIMYGKAFAVDGAHYAELLDTGNLVLANSDSASSYAWESFNNPTDTILPTQELSTGGKLSSRRTQSNYLKGRFQLQMQTIGSLVLNTIAIGSELTYYQSNTSDDSNQENSGQRLKFGDLGATSVLSVRMYVHPKSQSNESSSTTQSWINIWFVPKDICVNITHDQLGGGSCGFNSFCVSRNGWPTCTCLPGFSQSDNGCILEKAHACELGDLEPEQVYDMESLSNTYWPTSANFDVLQPTNEENCSRSCLNDCNCVVAVIKQGKCFKKKLPLSNGYVDTTVDGKALIKIAKSSDSDKHVNDKSNKNQIPGGWMFLCGSIILNVVLIIIGAAVFYLFSHHKQPGKLSTKSSISETNLHSFTYDELKIATDGFKVELGRGSFGTVYRGVVSLMNSTSSIVIAVKKLDKVLQEGEQEFKAEVSAIGRTHHRNLVRLIGFCDLGLNKLLIYEFMSKGSLADLLFRSLVRPDWNQRVQIATGIARGLLYLHEECASQIIHCDIKPQNILLDDSFTAKISDFGLAKLLMIGQTRTQTAIRGTKGYVAAEWFRNTPVTSKVDVYSYGVMLMEIICCRKCIELANENEEEVQVLTDWVYDRYKEGRMDLLVRNDKEASSDMKKVENLVMVAIWCIQEDPYLRPSMRMVSQMIEGVSPVSEPPSPYL